MREGNEWDCVFRIYQEDKEAQKLYLDYLRKIFKDHTDEKKEITKGYGQEPITKNDFKEIIDIILGYFPFNRNFCHQLNSTPTKLIFNLEFLV